MATAENPFPTEEDEVSEMLKQVVHFIYSRWLGGWGDMNVAIKLHKNLVWFYLGAVTAN